VPWARIFPTGGPEPRHPSQLYQAGMEGLILLIILHLLWRKENIRGRPGILTGVFWLGYGIARIIGEFFREPDAFLGYLAGGATMGQLLSIPMVLFGMFCIWRAIQANATR
jgi:phosphatidylglycerol---prolipoprotein diacylglyceryl transferase